MKNPSPAETVISFSRRRVLIFAAIAVVVSEILRFRRQRVKLRIQRYRLTTMELGMHLRT